VIFNSFSFAALIFFLVNSMNTHQRYIRYRKDELYHYNHNHDPKDGKFTSGPKGIVSKVKSALRKLDGQDDLDRVMTKKEAEEKAEKEPAKTSGRYEYGSNDTESALINKAGFSKKDFSEYGLNGGYLYKESSVKDANNKDSKLRITIDTGDIKDGLTGENALKAVSDLEKRWGDIDKSVKTQLAEKIAERGTWLDRDSSNTKLYTKDIASRIGTRDGKNTGASVRFMPGKNGANNYGEITYNDGDMYYGHVLTVEYDFDKDKISNFMVEG